MALLAEELVGEWLNRKGYFTIRGIKVGVHEIDLLAVRPRADGLECRHVEVTASVRPIGYITSVPLETQRETGRAKGSMKVRSDIELRQGIREWVEKKFDLQPKDRIRRHLCPATWSRELVVHQIRHEREVELLQEAGIIVHRLTAVIDELRCGGLVLEGAAGANLVDLVGIAVEEGPGAKRRLTADSSQEIHDT